MSDENKFFRFLWRANALLVLFAGLALVVYVVKDMPLERYTRHLKPLLPAGMVSAPPPAAKTTYALGPVMPGDFTPPPGTAPDTSAPGRERILALTRSLGDGVFITGPQVLPSPDAGFSGYYGLNEVNYLVVNGKTGESHWMFAGFDRTVLSFSKLAPNKDGHAAEPPTAYVMVVAEKDTNKDGVKDFGDGVAVYVYRPGDKLATRIMNADLIIDRGPGEPDSYVITYQDGNSRKTAVFSVPEFKLVSEKVLPDLPK